MYASVAAIAFIENIFPPFPSDVLVVAAGSLSAAGRVDPYVTIAVSTVGSTLGFWVMYRVGDWLGDHILEQGKIRFIRPEQVRKVEEWFRRYGYGVVVANRFLAGTRAVVSFFAGLSELRLWMCIGLSFVSALAWNTLLVLAGHSLGANWREIISYLHSYGQITTGIAVVLLVAYLVYRRYFRNRSNRPDGDR